MQIQIHLALVVVVVAAADFSVKFRTQFVFGAHLICIVAPIVAVVVASVASVAAASAAAPKAFHATLHFLFVVGRRRRRRQRGRAQDGANEPLPDGKTN